MDGDGYTDVVSTSSGDDKIAWYKNTDGAGNFGEQQVISSMAYGAYSIFSSDLDGDGDKDILSASTYDDKIALYENDGTGTFNYQRIISTTADGASSVYAADLDDDGDPDVVSASTEDGNITWYENRIIGGEAYFLYKHSIATGLDGACSVVAGDFNGDGSIDVASTAFWENEVNWFRNYTLKITAQPMNITVLCGSVTTFSVSTVNANTYQWQENDGSGFSDLQNDADYSGVTTTTLKINNATSAMNGYEYRCVTTNEAGSKNSDAATLSIGDTENPVITSVHNDQTVNANGSCEAILPDYTGTVTATDNCDADIDITQSPVSGTVISGTANTITLTATDDLGNTDEVTFNVEVIDITNPVITSVHNDQTVDANTDCEASLSDYTGDVTATDNCDASLNIAQSPAAGTIISGTTNEITLTVTDDAGNHTEVTFNVEVVDNSDPVITSSHNDQTIEADANCEASLPDYTGDVIVTDNCDVDLDITQSPVAGTSISGITNTVTLTATDDAGNSAEATFNVEVIDDGNPVITSIHNDQTVDAGENCEATLPDYTAEVIATDNCDADLEITQSPVAGAIISGSVNEITITVTDDGGNTSAVKFNVEVADAEAPEISCVEDQIFTLVSGNSVYTVMEPGLIRYLPGIIVQLQV